MQTRDRLLSVATRPGRWPHAPGPGARLRLRSAEAQRLAPPGSSSGSDVRVRMGWLRQPQRAPDSERHRDLSARRSLSAAHVRARSQHVSFPRLACHARQPRGRLAQGAQEQGGVRIALDGLAPQGGEPHSGVLRAVSTGLTRRRGGLAQVDQPTVAAFRGPLQHLEGPILAVLSDTQTGLVPAGATGVPARRHQCCQAPSLRHRAAPLAAADAACQRELRQTVREQAGDVLQPGPRRPPGPAGVLPVTGLVPSPGEEPPAPACHRPAPSASPRGSAPAAAQGSTQLGRHTRSLRTRTGRPPLRLAGLATYERLPSVAGVRLALLAPRYAPRLAPWYRGLQAAFSPWAKTSRALHHGAAWRRALASI